MAAAAGMAGGGSGGAPHPPPADDRGSRPGRRADATTPISTVGRAWRRRWSWRATSVSSPSVEREFLGGEPGRAGARAEERAAPGPSSARPARRRRGGAGGGGDRGSLRAGAARTARGDSATVAQAGRLAAQSREVAATASRPGAPPRARGRPPRRLGRYPRRASRGARARLADPRVAPGVRRARRQQRRSVPDGRLLATVDARGDHALGHGDLASRRAAAAIVAGRLGGGRLQPRRADTGDRGRRGPRRAVGRVDRGRSFGS